jgi:hypothetical protein
MGEVFSKAQRVNAWLGNAEKDSDKVLNSFEEIRRPQTDEPLSRPETPSSSAQEYMGLFQLQPYRSRLWIVQELVLAQDIMLFWGKSSISWADLIGVVCMFEKERAPAIRAIAAMQASDKGQRSFEELFARFGHLECALDHDRFYSLYGMVDDTSDLRSALPSPDYGLCVTEAFMQQLQYWRMRFPVESPMSFILTFIRHISQASINRVPCDCHSESSVSG